MLGIVTTTFEKYIIIFSDVTIKNISKWIPGQ